MRDPAPAHPRGAGIGRANLGMTEEEAFRRGCRAATLATVNFRAPKFHARNGREEIGGNQTAPTVTRI